MYTIGQVAKMTGVSTDTLRYYEKEELLKPVSKTDAGYRLYDDTVIRRLRFIKHAQHSGFSLMDVHELLLLKQTDNACCRDVRRLAIEKKLQIEQKIKILQKMSQALDLLIQQCTSDNDTLHACPILETLERSLETI